MRDINSVNLWTALITPLNDNSEIDYDSIKKLLKQQEEAGNGVLILGSTGEALNLDLEEKQRIFEFAHNLDLKVPLMAGIGGINLNQTRKEISFLNDLSYDCYLLVTPLYAKPGHRGQEEWFKTLLDESNKPCMLYNVPGRTGVNLNLETVRSLKEHPNFWAIKEASGTPVDFEKYVHACSPKKVFSGDDGMLTKYININCHGLVSVASNCWPKETNLYTRLSLTNELDSDHKWSEWSEDLFLASNPIPVKTLMAHKGEIASSLCRPPLNHRDMKKFDKLINTDNEVKSWYNRINK